MISISWDTRAWKFYIRSRQERKKEATDRPSVECSMFSLYNIASSTKKKDEIAEEEKEEKEKEGGGEEEEEEKDKKKVIDLRESLSWKIDKE